MDIAGEIIALIEDEVLFPEIDILMCFGKTLTLKSLAPPSRKRKKKRRTKVTTPAVDEALPDA